jgi:hypothetical protein
MSTATPTPPNEPVRQAIEAALAAHGLQLRGGWVPGAQDVLPILPGGHSAVAVWMVGVVGSKFWPFFKASSFYVDGLKHPLDRWSRSVGNELAQRWGGLALFPFDGPPYHPFQQWAARAEPLQSSPLMLRIHPRYGLWHAYRFALALPTLRREDLSPIDPVSDSDLCLRCSGQPCLHSCPVQAFDGQSYALQTCATHLHTPQGQLCMQSGCLARLSCPVGSDYRYSAEHAGFHMQAFAHAHD